MSVVGETAQSPALGVRFVLPGNWVTIPLSDKKIRDRAIKNAARGMVGAGDDLPQKRAQLRESLTSAATEGQRLNATYQYYGLELVPGVLLPVGLSVAWPEVLEGSVDDRGAALLESFEDDDSSQFERLSLIDLTLLRHVSVTDADGMPGMRVDYWVMAPDDPRTLLLSFSAPARGLFEPYLELFDQIVSTLDWQRSA